MAHEILIGIDLGTTVLKVGAFEANNGRLLGQAASRLPVRHLPEGGRELTANAIDKAFVRVVQELRRALGARWWRVAGVGVAAQGGSSLVVERATGCPRTDMFLWNDARAHGWVRKLTGQVDKRFWSRFFLFDMPPTGLGRLAWLKERCPELFTDKFLHIGAGEYLFHKLTRVWRQDAGNAIQVGSYNARKRKLDAAALDLIGVPLSFVAPLRKNHEISPLCRDGARLLGVSEGLPVAGPYIDQEACYMAALGAAPHPLQCSLGTAWVGNFELPERFEGRSPSQMLLPAPTGDGGLVVQPLYSGNTAWDWALAAFVDPDIKRSLAKAVAVFKRRLFPPHGLVGIPWCTQQNPFSPGAYGGGIFVGVSTHTTTDDLLRATAAGLVFELCRVFEDLKRLRVIDAIVMQGGASRGPYFRRLVASVFDPVPVLWQKDYDVAAARGSVFALSPHARQGEVNRVTIDKSEAEAAKEAFGLYTSTFDRVLGHIAETAPFRCQKKAR